MTPATQHLFLIFTYCLILFARMRRLAIRWRRPLMGSPGYFAGLRVPEGFLKARGARLLILYRRWLLLPWLVEACVLGALIATGRFYDWLTPLIIGISVLDVANCLVLLRQIRKMVKPFAVEELPTAIALPLETRTLRAYTRRWLEILIVLSLATCFSLIFWHRSEHPWRIVLLATYVQLGMLLIKQSLVDRRTRVPVENAQAYHYLQELRRNAYINECDWVRAFAALFVVILTTVDFYGKAVGQWMSLPWLALAAVMMARTARESRRVLQLTASLKPLKPRLVPVENVATTFLYRPDHPAMFVKRERGYAVNFGSPRTMICSAYVIGGMILGAANLRAQAPQMVAVEQTSEASALSLQGTWQGILGAKLHVIVAITGDKTAGWNATLESPDQGPRTIPASSVKLDGKKLRKEFESIQALFEGTIEGAKLHGTWKQGLEIPLDLTRQSADKTQ